MKIAVIGAGISGLIAADDLCRRHEVTIFEAGAALGGHANTVTVRRHGEQHEIDTGFIVFNDRTYPNFCRRLELWGVESVPTEMSFSVRHDAAGLEYNGSSLNGLFAQRRNLLRPSFQRMLRDILRFNREGAALADGRANDGEAGLSVRQFLDRRGFSRSFAEHYLLPMGAAIWSCALGAFEDFPIRFVAEFYRNHGLLQLRNRPQWRTIVGGSRRYITAAERSWGGRIRIRLKLPVVRVVRAPEAAIVQPQAGHSEAFDHVIFACHADQALRLLADPSPVERRVLSAFPYSRNTAVLHTDTRLLPRRRRAWASWNYLCPDHSGDRSAPATVTYCMNILQHIRSETVYNVTLNCEDHIDPDCVLQRFVYEHPVFTGERDAAQARHRELLNTNRTSFCGAYWGNGFHEDGVVSGMAVAHAVNQRAAAGMPRLNGAAI